VGNVEDCTSYQEGRVAAMKKELEVIAGEPELRQRKFAQGRSRGVLIWILALVRLRAVKSHDLERNECPFGLQRVRYSGGSVESGAGHGHIQIPRMVHLSRLLIN
jgi:hypothetical protein